MRTLVFITLAWAWALQHSACAEPVMRELLGPLRPISPLVHDRQEESLNLKTAGLRALLNHPDLQVGEALRKAAEAEVGRASAPYYPFVESRLGWGQAEIDQLTPQGALFRNRPPRNAAAGVVGTQLLSDFGKRRARSEVADQGFRAAEARQIDIAQERLVAVGTAFYRLSRALRLVEIEQRNLELIRLRLEDTERLFGADTARPDIAISEADLSVAQRSYLEAQNEEALARIDLGTAMGEPQSYRGELEVSLMLDPGWTAEEVLSLACEHRPDLQAAMARTQASTWNLKAARADYRPDLRLETGYELYARSYPLDLRQWNVQVNLNFPIFNEPLLSSSVDLAEARLSGAQAEQRQLELSINQEILRSHLDVELLQRRARQAEIAVISSFRSFVEVWALYRSGQGTCRDVSIAQRDLVEAQRSAADTDLEVQLALLNLYRGSGQLSLETLGQTISLEDYRRHLIASPRVRRAPIIPPLDLFDDLR